MSPIQVIRKKKMSLLQSLEPKIWFLEAGLASYSLSKDILLIEHDISNLLQNSIWPLAPPKALFFKGEKRKKKLLRTKGDSNN